MENSNFLKILLVAKWPEVDCVSQDRSAQSTERSTLKSLGGFWSQAFVESFKYFSLPP